MPFQKGHSPYKGIEKTQFQKGLIPWNKGIGERGAVICKNCNRQFVDLICKQRQFCSKKCAYEWMAKNQMGSNNPNWHEIKKENRGLPRSIKNRIFKECFGWCMQCGNNSDNVQMEVHHIIPYKINPTHDPQKTKLVLLCRKCHRWIHAIKKIPSDAQWLLRGKYSAIYETNPT